MSDHTQEPPTTQAVDIGLSDVASHVEALNLAGLAFTAKRLLGRDPGPLVGQFAMWSRTNEGGLPAVTQPFWEALAPLGSGRPTSPAAGLCDLLLRGREADGDLVTKAANECAAAGKALFRTSPLAGLDLTAPEHAELARLLDTVKDYWRRIGGVYQEARPLVLAGDVTSAIALLERRREQSTTMTRRVAEQAARVVAIVPAGSLADEAHRAEPPPEPVATVVEQPVVEPVADGAGQPTEVVHHEGLQLSDEVAEAFATHRPLAEPEPERPRPVEVISRKPVRNHPFLPIVFLLIVSGVALYVLYAVINNPANPLR